MTVEARIQHAMSLLKTASGTIATFAFETKDDVAKKFYVEAAEQIDALNDKLGQRLEVVRTEDPPAEDDGNAKQESTASLLLRRRPIKKL